MNEDSEWLRLVPREIPEEKVVADEKLRDQERGPYVPHHHQAYYGTAGH